MRLPLGWFGLSFAVAALTVIVARLDPSITPNLATGAIVSASSGTRSEALLGRLLDGDIWHQGHQTDSEANPWVQLEFRNPTRISRVVVYNRVDCCWEGAVPLALQVAGDDRNFKDVAHTEQKFKKWKADIVPQTARYLRIQLKRTGSLVLNEIEVE